MGLEPYWRSYRNSNSSRRVFSAPRRSMAASAVVDIAVVRAVRADVAPLVVVRTRCVTLPAVTNDVPGVGTLTVDRRRQVFVNSLASKNSPASLPDRLNSGPIPIERCCLDHHANLQAVCRKSAIPCSFRYFGFAKISTVLDRQTFSNGDNRRNWIKTIEISQSDRTFIP